MDKGPCPLTKTLPKPHGLRYRPRVTRPKDHNATMSKALAPAQPRKVNGNRTITPYDDELAAALLRRYSQGELLTEIMVDLGLPGLGTIWEWKIRNPNFAVQYSRARELSAEALELLALERAKSSTGMTAQADRLYVDTLKWAAAKRFPRMYSEKAEIAVSVSEDSQTTIENAGKARRMLMERLNKMAVPEPLTIEGNQPGDEAFGPKTEAKPHESVDSRGASGRLHVPQPTSAATDRPGADHAQPVSPNRPD